MDNNMTLDENLSLEGFTFYQLLQEGGPIVGDLDQDKCWPESL